MEKKSNINADSDVRASSKRGFKAICKQVIVFPFVLLIKIYQVCISPFTPSSCRFTPTCSSYSLQAFKKYGPLKGAWLSFKRIIRCHPWGGSGYDPVP